MELITINGKFIFFIFYSENILRIILDFKLFTPGQDLPDNLLWITEQYPGGFESGDVTYYLRLGYWPSYNRPFFPCVFNITGYPPYVKL